MSGRAEAGQRAVLICATRAVTVVSSSGGNGDLALLQRPSLIDLHRAVSHTFS
jgi:hypothetical protein